MTDLIVDPQIRTWVFLPIVILTFMAGILRHYLTILIKTEKPMTVDKIREGQVLLRAQLLRKNGRYITQTSFHMRKNSFIKENSSRLEEKQQQQVPSLCNLGEESVLRETFLTNFINYLPMVLIGSWLMYMLSGFILTKIPIPLTLRFKNMLQKDIFLNDLDAEWVSSASWYFLNVCGLRNIYFMVLGENNCTEQHMEFNTSLPPNTREFFKNEIEALVIYKHKFIAGEHFDSLLNNYDC